MPYTGVLTNILNNEDPLVREDSWNQGGALLIREMLKYFLITSQTVISQQYFYKTYGIQIETAYVD